MSRFNLLISLVFLLLAALACDLPWQPANEIPSPTVAEEITEPELPTEIPLTEEPTEELTEEPYACAPDMVQGLAFTVEFCYPMAFATGFTQAIIPEKLPSSEAAYWDFYPDTIEIFLLDYPVNNTYHQPHIFIYPVDAYIALGSNIQTTITELQAMLDDEPVNPDFIPFLPVENAAQIMQAKVHYLNFRNGSGVGFITQYSQGAIPISNDSAIYAFMGLTDDGQYLISATFPITHPLFYPDMLTEPPEGWMTFGQNLETYLDTMEADLATQTPDSFTPNLAPLDEMMTSFLIPADAIP